MKIATYGTTSAAVSVGAALKDAGHDVQRVHSFTALFRVIQVSKETVGVIIGGHPEPLCLWMAIDQPIVELTLQKNRSDRAIVDAVLAKIADFKKE